MPWMPSAGRSAVMEAAASDCRASMAWSSCEDGSVGGKGKEALRRCRPRWESGMLPRQRGRSGG